MADRVRRPLLVFAAMLAVAVAARADYRLEKEFSLGSGGALSVRTEAGGAEVRGGEGETAKVLITSKRDDFEEKFDVRFEETAGRLAVIVERRGSKLTNCFGAGGGGALVTVTVPRRTAVEVKSSGGGVAVEEVEGTVEAGSSGGGARVVDVVGDVRVHSSGGGVSAERVRGKALLDSSGGSVTARSVSGDLEAESSGGGVKIEEAGGRVTASSSGGSVRVGFAPGNAAGGSVQSSGGGVAATVDPAVGLEIDAVASGGGVDCDLPVTVRGKMSRDTLRGQLNGGGARLELRSSGGGVTIESL
jgi:hypothetical protein